MAEVPSNRCLFSLSHALIVASKSIYRLRLRSGKSRIKGKSICVFHKDTIQIWAKSITVEMLIPHENCLPVLLEMGIIPIRVVSESGVSTQTHMQSLNWNCLWGVNGTDVCVHGGCCRQELHCSRDAKPAFYPQRLCPHL